jgi:hypothetical protein
MIYFDECKRGKDTLFWVYMPMEMVLAEAHTFEGLLKI